ncbi:ATP-binding protein [Ascidiimonas sp. W6]|uniref:tetratricopeptide repeat-containing hybrid sensor histidine kinase/response regulator n=1 Tax=Ascidiimonas meishanensis TaxID=3128903 RepID=UPI0030ED370E
MNRYLTCLLLALVFAGFSFGQGKGALEDSINDLFRRAYYYKNKANYRQAIATVNELHALADKRVNKKNLIIDCNNLFALINIEFGRIENSEHFLKVNEITSKGYEYPAGEATSNALNSVILANQKQYIEALQLLRESETLIRSKKINLQSMLSYYEGAIHYQRQDYEKSLLVFRKLLPVQGGWEPEYINTKILIYLASIDSKRGLLEEAMINGKKALSGAINNDFPKLQQEIYHILHEISSKMGDYEKAYAYLVDFNRVKEVLEKKEKEIYLEEPLDKNAQDYFERALDQLGRDAKEQEERVNMSKLTSVLSSALLIIISLLTISLYRNNQIKFKTNDLLLKKNLELETAKEEAEKAMQAKAQFLSTVSHELRTPLYAVTGLTHLLLEENPSESQKEHLKSLKFSGEYLLNFINDILQINKIEAKKLTVQKVPLNIRKVLKDVVDSLYQTAKENQNVIRLEIDEDIPTELLGDPLKLSQILINLIGNASKFTQKGQITVIAELVDSNEDNASIYFKVRDNGIGISKEMQATIFESFAQGSVQINRKYGGTGLGLTIVKSLLSLFDSEIELESEIGKGSTFMFNIRFDTATGSEEVPPVETKIDVDDQFFENLHLLLVEDNKINQVITKKMLAKKGMTCDIANDGYEAIERAKKPIYNAILMDIHMPGISGIKTTQEIRKFNKKVPIIALTAISLDESTEDFFEAGCNDLITKPFRPEVFYQKIGDNILRNIKVDI